MMTSSVWMRVLSGLGACVAALVVLFYAIVLQFEGMPDEEVSAGSHALLVAKLTVAVVAGSALIVGALSGWRWVILGGCSLFFVDFALWLVQFSGVVRSPSFEHPEPGPASPPPLFWLVLIIGWGLFPGLLAVLAYRRSPERAMSDTRPAGSAPEVGAPETTKAPG
ncbi:hypothetical protein ACIO52_30675 [Nocardia sp. NPDC087230]|uniref:hypothetical protein n=1 Tax=Nocardia sp. NPDC087230 TaxID=3364331 RepID=UPI0038000666